jgi:hypothetical protein
MSALSYLWLGSVPLMEGTEIIRGTYLKFLYHFKEGKTQIWVVKNLATDEEIGEIRWRNGWRQYVFATYGNIDLAENCMRFLADFCKEMNDEHKKRLEAEKNG